MEAKDTERIEAMKNCLAKWFDKGRSYSTAPITKGMLAELEAEGEAQAEISFKAGIREVVEWLENNLEPTVPMSLKYEKWHGKLKEWGIN